MRRDIYDVAKEANVSIATVSRVLNNSPAVAPKTAQRVRAALRKLNYQPNEIARGLVTKRMQTVGILTVDIRSISYAITAYTIEQNLSRMGYNSILCNTFGSSETTIGLVKMLLGRGVSAIICIGSVFDRTFNESNLLNEFSDIPFILMNYYVEADNVYSILNGDQEGIQMAIDHLVSRGHKNILFVKDMGSDSSNRKATAFRNYLKTLGLSSNKTSVCSTVRSLEGGAAAIDEILGASIPFSAIVFNDDLTAVGGLKRLQELGYSIPKDVALMGYNNSIYSSCCTPTLTTVDLKLETMGNMAVTLLRELLESKSPAKVVNLLPELIVREST